MDVMGGFLSLPVGDYIRRGRGREGGGVFHHLEGYLGFWDTGMIVRRSIN